MKTATDTPMVIDDLSLTLERLPSGGDPTLRGWSTADLYMVRHAVDSGLLERAGHILVANDAFGAVTVGLRSQAAGADLWLWNDSALAQRTVRHNLELNGLSDALRDFAVNDDASPEAPEYPAFDAVFIRFPKSLAWLEEQLLRLGPYLAPGATVVAGGMIKHTPRRAFELLESCVGPTTTSLGWKKARLAFSTAAPAERAGSDSSATPTKSFTVDASVPHVAGMEIVGLPGVFSWASLDLGARLVLEHLDVPSDAMTVVDQGCGNGILAMAMALGAAPEDAQVWATDDSHQAVRCARLNAAKADLTGRIRFVVDDDLAALDDDFGVTPDFIVCNPPFHQDHVTGDHIAWHMFLQAKRALAPGGTYLVVGNRHMGYQDKLTRIFGRCFQVGADKRFVVLRASKRG